MMKQKKVYIVLGRNGDILMVCRQLKEPAIIACLPEFSQIVEELFPQHELCILRNIPKNGLEAAFRIVQFKHPDKEIIIAQQDGTNIELMLDYRNFQSFQEDKALPPNLDFNFLELTSKSNNNFSRAIIFLDGQSSEIINIEQITDNICHALRLLQIPFEIYHPHTKGFIKLRDDMNQEDTLYILNDSLQYHLCEKPNILIYRSAPWVQSTPKLTTIGAICQEVMTINVSLLNSIIARNKPMRQHFDGKVAMTHLVVSDYTPNRLDAIGRFGIAAFSWHILSLHDIHFQATFITEETPELPLVNNILKEGLELLKHPDDILIITNRDICLVKEATGVIRSFMDSQNIDSCFAHRVDLKFTGLQNFADIAGMTPYAGIDLFAFRPGAKCIPELLETPLQLGRLGWDSFWASKIENRLPFNICYHYPHNNEWTKETGIEGNTFNVKSIASKTDLDVTHDINGTHYNKIR